MIRIVLAMIAIIAASVSVPARAQGPTRPPDAAPVRILAVGGFLGQLDGFCEHPGGTYDNAVAAPYCAPGGPGGHAPGGPSGRWPAALGGVIGVKGWVEHQRTVGSLLFLTGNNQPADYSFSIPPYPTKRDAQVAGQTRAVDQNTASRRQSTFWTQVSSLNPTLVALGPEDFIRSLRNPPREGPRLVPARRAQEFVDWVRNNDLPLLASNAVIKLTRDKLNAVKDGEYELEIPEDESIEWVQSLKLSHPSNAIMNIVLEESTTPLADSSATGRTVSTTSKLDDDKAHTTITVTAGSLSPGMHYRLQVTAEGQTHNLVFRTHQALMPSALSADPRVGPNKTRTSNAELLRGFPVAVHPLTARDGAVLPNERDDVLIISLIDSGTGLGLGTSAWKYQEREPIDPGKDSVESTISFTSASSAVAAILRRLAAPGARTPYVVLLSSLADEDTLDLLDTYPEIRTVVLPPESSLLGRASRATDTNRGRLISHRFSHRPQVNANDPTMYSGDLGFGSIVDIDRPTATQLLTRPEWIGETGATLDVALARNSYGEWGTYEPRIDVRTIPGIALTSERRPEGLFYWPFGRPDLAVGPYKPYLPVGRTISPKNLENFLGLWQDSDDFAIAAGEALRTAFNADVAIVPDDLYDPDAIDWLDHALNQSDGAWLSRFILERAVFRSHRFVRADVPGSELLDKIGKALNDPLGTGTNACAVGMNGSSCLATIDKKHPELARVRDRAIVTTLFYNVAAPDAIAQKHALEHDDEIEDSKDALGALDDYLARHVWEQAANPEPPTLGELVATRARQETRSYLNVRTLDLGVDQMFVGEPDGREGVLANLPVDFKAAKPERTLSGKIDFDMAREGPLFAGRMLGLLDLSKRTVFKDDPVPDDITFPRDSFLFGARLEMRRLKRDEAVEFRFYGGGFFEGPTRPTQLNLTATRDGAEQRDGFKNQEQAGFRTPLTFEPSQFTYGAVGVDMLPAAKDIIPGEAFSATVTKATADLAWGQQSNVLVGLTLGGVPQSLDRFLGEGAQKLLNEFFTNNSTTFNDDVEWAAQLESKGQMRLRLNLEGDLGWTWKSKTFKATVAFQYNYFRTQDAPDLALSNSLKFTSDFKIPLVWRFELVPSYEVQRASIRANENDTFWAQRFKLRANLPLFVRFGGGRFVQ